MNTTVTLTERELGLVREGLKNSLLYAEGAEITLIELLAGKLRDAEAAQAERPVSVYPQPLPEDAGMALAEAGAHRVATDAVIPAFWK